MVLVIADVKAFSADIPLTVQIFLVPANFSNLIILNANFQSA
jgi:hypothetical protein